MAKRPLYSQMPAHFGGIWRVVAIGVQLRCRPIGSFFTTARTNSRAVSLRDWIRLQFRRKKAFSHMRLYQDSTRSVSQGTEFMTVTEYIFYPQRKFRLQPICGSLKWKTLRSQSLGPDHPQRCQGTVCLWVRWVEMGWSRENSPSQWHRTPTLRSHTSSLEPSIVSSSLLSNQGKRASRWLESKLQVRKQQNIFSIQQKIGF